MLTDQAGARIYHFRRVFHIWGQEKARELLENTKKAMDEFSRILIADMVLPDIGCPWNLAMQDLNMMSLGGMERSESEWKTLLDSTGLVLQKIWIN
jgi:O-methyltransferase domain